MIKSLIRYGNQRVLVIDKALLEAAGLDEKTALFQITVNPNGGMLIQSVDNLHQEAFREVVQENDILMKRLSKQ